MKNFSAALLAFAILSAALICGYASVRARRLWS